MGRVLPRYPVYIPSKGRWEKSNALTVQALARDGCPFKLVVEPQHVEQYTHMLEWLDFDGVEMLVLPDDNPPELGAVPVRCWIKRHSTEAGAGRHWQLDDNMRGFYRVYRGHRIPCESGLAMRVCEDFTDRYENVALSGLNYDMFGVNTVKPFVANCHVYSATLVNNEIPHEWRGRYNDDTDLCLQVLSDGWCTILLNAFLVKKLRTMQVKGGMSTVMYAGDGRLKMARSLERVWPYVAETRRRFERPQHVIRNAWKSFDTPLRLKPDADLTPVDYGLELKQVDEVKSAKLQRLKGEWDRQRIEIRTNGDRRLFHDRWEFFPEAGVNSAIEALLRGVPVTCGADVRCDDLERIPASGFVITAPLDVFVHQPGMLEWRGIRMRSRYVPTDDPTGKATPAYVVNRPSRRVPYTRTVETKWATGQWAHGTVVSEEFPGAPARHYPVATVDGRNEQTNRRLQAQIAARLVPVPVVFCGRLATYSYMDQDEAIYQALVCADALLAQNRWTAHV